MKYYVRIFAVIVAIIIGIWLSSAVTDRYIRNENQNTIDSLTKVKLKLEIEILKKQKYRIHE